MSTGRCRHNFTFVYVNGDFFLHTLTSHFPAKPGPLLNWDFRCSFTAQTRTVSLGKLTELNPILVAFIQPPVDEKKHVLASAVIDRMEKLRKTLLFSFFQQPSGVCAPSLSIANDGSQPTNLQCRSCSVNAVHVVRIIQGNVLFTNSRRCTCATGCIYVSSR